MENTLMVEHRETGKLQDSLEIGSASKGGAIKIYGDFKNKEEFEAKIISAFELRKKAQYFLGGETNG